MLYLPIPVAYLPRGQCGRLAHLTLDRHEQNDVGMEKFHTLFIIYGRTHHKKWIVLKGEIYVQEEEAEEEEIRGKEKTLLTCLTERAFCGESRSVHVKGQVNLFN